MTPFGEVLALAMLLVALIITGIGVAVGLVLCFIAAALLAAGVVSVSALIGLLRGSWLAALRVFVWQAGVVAGLCAGIAIVAGARFFLDVWKEGAGPWIGGAVGGIAGGMLVAFLLDFLLRRFAVWLEKSKA